MKNYKLKIGNNPELSELVQRKAFELGYRWEAYYKHSPIDFVCLFACSNGEMFGIYNMSKEYFDSHQNEEISIPDFLKLKPEKEEVPEVPKRKLYAYLIEGGEIRYFKSGGIFSSRAPEYDLEF